MATHEEHDYKKLIAWQKSITLTRLIYKLTKQFPSEEKYCLTDQIRRAVVSIPSNIAEGYGRMTSKEIIHFLTIARGSLFEVETQLIISEELGYSSKTELNELHTLVSEVSRLILSLIRKEKSKI